MQGPDPALFQLMAARVTDYAIFLLDPKGVIQSWNAGAALIKQYSEKEIIGRHISVFYTRADIERDWPNEELRRATRDGRLEDEGWRVRKDGSRFWANVIITALRDEKGTLLAFSKITRDLTVRKHIEETMRQSEERFRLLVEGVEDYAIYMLDPDGMVTSWNAGARRAKGYEAAEIVGRHFSCFYSTDDIEAGKPWSELALAREQGRAEDEGWRVRKDGSRFWAKVVVTALHDTQGTLRGFAKVTQDLTQRRHADTLELSAANVNDFLAVLAHELRNPLAPIRNAVQLQKMARGNAAVQEQARQIIERQSGQLSRIVDDLLEISRITRGAMTMQTQPVGLAAVVQRAIETTRPAVEAGSHTIEVDNGNDSLHVLGDELRLNQVMSNLLNNAARYSEPGGKIVIKTGKVLRDGHPFASLSISDTGHGIAPGMLEAIFGMFIQGKDAMSRPAGGLGVGLALSRAIVELHHGTLTARSDGVGKGAEFTICLPLLEAFSLESIAQVPVEANPGPAPGQGMGRRVLIVDDNVDAAVVLASLLNEHGYEAIAVHDGPAAIDQSESFRPEVVLLDIGMPGMNGLEVARRLRERHREPRPLLVAVTGWGKPEDERQSREAGIDIHMVKPVEELKLLEVLQKAGTLH